MTYKSKMEKRSEQMRNRMGLTEFLLSWTGEGFCNVRHCKQVHSKQENNIFDHIGFAI